ncbi:hypothetical protein [Streptomyces rishiriensis]|uniref:Peptidoglycan binding domain-containing protein n=1 Tax=Streptomyces rishiriensis TaxID=68264 RepID=A0ABU0NX25_STRRH|nr:hypothetical protein [Streptomyces rishiriensis]MDQ0583268.1 hypothetical protein [Streptomyces rishiriensis]
MSRETDSPSSGPNGRGGAAYPSGTPPYGTPVVSDAGADAGRSSAQPEERKTETTLTTRIRINIPGSRPIPPVVMRTPVADTEGRGADSPDGNGQAGADAPSAPSPAAVGHSSSDTGSFELPADPAPAAETSNWFAPRKSGPGKGGQGGGSTNGAGLPGGSAAGTGAPTGPPAGAAGPGPATGAGAPGGARPGNGRPGGVVGAMSVPGGSRPGGTNGAGIPGGATGGPVAPGHGGGTGSFDVTEALAAGPRPGQPGQPPVQGQGPVQGAGGAEPRRDNLPYFSGNGQNGQNGQAGQAGQNGFGAPNGSHGQGPQGGLPAGPGGSYDFNGPEGPGGPAGRGGPQGGPAGPTGGPVTGDGLMAPPMGGAPHGAPGVTRPPGAPGGQAGPGGPRAVGAGPGTGRLPGGGLSDDTAILTPQKPAPEPGAGGYGGRPVDNVSGHTVTSGIPVVPGGQGGTRADGPLPHTPPRGPDPAPQSAPAGDSRNAKKKKKKSRGKLPLLGGLAVVAGVGLYGAGLLMNHSDVPKGTTVLGVDIGGGTSDDAVKKLDDAFGERVTQVLKLSVDGDTVTLKPDQAGLQFDLQATVDDAAKSDYNPVSVIGSLFGQHREVEPAMPVDEEKLQAALESAAGGSGSATDGTIKFESGKAVAVYGKAGKGIDAAQAQEAVVEAYRGQVETGTTTAVKVPTTDKKPTISDAEVDRMMKEFAEPAMSGKVTVMTDAAHTVSFSPKNSLWKFLQVKAVNGKLVESYDQAALTELYGGTFNGVLITRGTGQKTAVTVQDVISALRPALKSETERTGVIDTDPS